MIAWETFLGEYAMMMLRLYKSRSLSTTAPYQFFFMGSYIVLLYYLPVYFQSVMGASPIRSGVDNLPLVVTAAFFAVAGGAVVMTTGHAQQVMLVSSGNYCHWPAIHVRPSHIHSKMGRLSIILGAGMLFAIMHGLNIVQAYVFPEDLSAVTANLLLFQTVGSAFSTSIGNAAFVNRLLATQPTVAPGVNPTLVLLTGAAQLREVFLPDVLPGILDTYMVGLKATYALAVAFSGTPFLRTLAVLLKKLPTHEGGEAPMACG